jgi:hypothetical protein
MNIIDQLLILDAQPLGDDLGRFGFVGRIKLERFEISSNKAANDVRRLSYTCGS